MFWELRSQSGGPTRLPSIENPQSYEIFLLRRQQAQTLPDVTPLIVKRYRFSKMDVNFGTIMLF